MLHTESNPSMSSATLPVAQPPMHWGHGLAKQAHAEAFANGAFTWMAGPFKMHIARSQRKRNSKWGESAR